MNQYVEQIVKRHQALNESIKKGFIKDGDLAISVGDRFAWPISKDYLGMAKFDAVDSTSINEREKSVIVTITDSSIDRDGDIVEPLGCQYADFARNPIWFWGHQSIEIPIGTSKSPADGKICIWPEENRVIAKCWFDKEDPDADFIFGKICRGFVNAVSVAFVPIEAYRRDHTEKANPRSEHGMTPLGWRFSLWSLTEVSWVGIPANQNATVVRDWLDHEKSFISPKLQKNLELCCHPAKGCFNGWCPPCSCEVPAEKTQAKIPHQGANGKLYQKIGNVAKSYRVENGIVKTKSRKALDVNGKTIRAGDEVALGHDDGIGRLYSVSLVEGDEVTLSNGTRISGRKLGLVKSHNNRTAKTWHSEIWTATRRNGAEAYTWNGWVVYQQGESTWALVDPSGKYMGSAEGQGALDRKMGFAESFSKKSAKKTCCGKCKEGKPCCKHESKTVKSNWPNALKVTGEDLRKGDVVLLDNGSRHTVDLVESANKPEYIVITYTDGTRGGGNATQTYNVLRKGKSSKSQPSDDISSEKACLILRDGEVNGKPLTEAQRGMFGAACGKKGLKIMATKKPAKKNQVKKPTSKNITKVLYENRSTYRKLTIFESGEENEHGGGCRVTLSYWKAGHGTVRFVGEGKTRSEASQHAKDKFDVWLDANPQKPDKKLKPKRKEAMNTLAGPAGGYTVPPENTEMMEDVAVETVGPMKCPACAFVTADSAMRFCPHCGMGLVSEAKDLDEEDQVTKDESETKDVDEKFMKTRKSEAAETDDEVEGSDVSDDEEEKSEQPKHSAQVLAHLHNHIQNALDYIDQEHGKMDHPEMADALVKHKEELEAHKSHYKDLMEEHHPDENIEEMSKAIGGSGEEEAVDEEMTPEEEEKDESAEEDVEGEDQLSGKDIEDEPVERAEEYEDEEEEDDTKPEEGEDVAETPTDEILERYRQPKSLKKIGKQWAVEFKDGTFSDVFKSHKLASMFLKQCHRKSASCHKGHFEVLRDAGQHMYDLATQAKDIPSYHKAGLMHHSDEIGKVCKELEDGMSEEKDVEDVEGEDKLPGEDIENKPVERDMNPDDEGHMIAKGDDDKEEEIDEEEQELIKQLHNRMGKLNGTIFQSTGKKLN